MRRQRPHCPAIRARGADERAAWTRTQDEKRRRLHNPNASALEDTLAIKLSIPISRAAVELAGRSGRTPLDHALRDGEDYELLFTAPSYVVERVNRTLSCPVTVIGDIVEGAAGMVTLLDADGTVAAINRPGWDHFRP